VLRFIFASSPTLITTRIKRTKNEAEDNKCYNRRKKENYQGSYLTNAKRRTKHLNTWPRLFSELQGPWTLKEEDIALKKVSLTH
jgi:hypothetical protein